MSWSKVAQLKAKPAAPSPTTTSPGPASALSRGASARRMISPGLPRESTSVLRHNRSQGKFVTGSGHVQRSGKGHASAVPKWCSTPGRHPLQQKQQKQRTVGLVSSGGNRGSSHRGGDHTSNPSTPRAYTASSDSPTTDRRATTGRSSPDSGSPPTVTHHRNPRLRCSPHVPKQTVQEAPIKRQHQRQHCTRRAEDAGATTTTTTTQRLQLAPTKTTEVSEPLAHEPDTMPHPPTTNAALSSGGKTNMGNATTLPSADGNTDNNTMDSPPSPHTHTQFKQLMDKRMHRKLNAPWSLYYHSPASSDWTLESYTKVATVDTVETFCTLVELVEQQVVHLHLGMFFLMRDTIMPTWEDPNNRKGGCWSYKVPMHEVNAIWRQLAVRLVGEELSTPSLVLNGISMSPKRGFCIVKVWNRSSSEKDKGQLCVSDMPKLLSGGESLYTAFCEKK